MASVNLDIAQRLDITCRRGDTFNLVIDFGANMASSTWSMEVRETDTSAATLGIGFTITTASTGDYANNEVTISATPTNMTKAPGTYVYDLQLENGSNITTYLYGLFKINQDVTT